MCVRIDIISFVEKLTRKGPVAQLASASVWHTEGQGFESPQVHILIIESFLGKDMSDIPIQCASCKQEFVWTEGEQDFYKEKGLEKPELCMMCRAMRKAEDMDPGKGMRG